jgi:hypothetical protein
VTGDFFPRNHREIVHLDRLNPFILIWLSWDLPGIGSSSVDSKPSSSMGNYGVSPGKQVGGEFLTLREIESLSSPGSYVSYSFLLLF